CEPDRAPSSFRHRVPTPARDPRMKRFLSLLAFGLVAPSLTTFAGELPKAEPGAVGLSKEKLEELKPALQKLADDGQVAGGVVLIARHGKVAYVAAYGDRDLASHTPMTQDTIF